jgi:hypothetical protein
MRTYGKLPLNANDPSGPYRWVEITTDAAGFNDGIYLTTLVQTLKLNLNESPFYANWGIPAKQSVLQQIAPDFFVGLTQQNFAPYFAALIIAKANDPTPTYNISAITHQGATLIQQVPV